MWREDHRFLAKRKIFAFLHNKFVTIAYVVWNMKTLPNPHRWQKKSCHCKKLTMIEVLQSNHPFDIGHKKAFAELAKLIYYGTYKQA